ncbi:MAG: hypothetical protein HOP03_09935 [Lysobacter sp.]|nr:hypothetical protein [Lysobacter sp.]
MIEFHLLLREADTFVATVRVIAIDRGGAGIRRVRIFDRSHVPIHEQIANCAPYSEFLVESIERGRFPLFAEGVECNDAITPPDTPYALIPPGMDGPGIPTPCSPLFCAENAACRDAEAGIVRARNVILERCTEVNSIRSTRDAYATAVAALFVLAAALYAAMAAVSAVPIVGQALGAVLLVIATIALGVAIGLSIRVLREQLRLEEAQRRLEDARKNFTSAADAVARSCCPGCISVDLTQPAC